MRRTHPLLRNCRDNAKLACHCTARYKIAKVRGPDSLELDVEMRKKEERNLDKINGYFIEHLILTYTIELMDDLGLIRCIICWRF